MNNLEEIGYLDYDKLKQYGLEYIQQIGHVNWSDYNLHDPGVTFLEALCFSLVDLGYRTQLPVEDYLTPKGENHPHLDGTVFFPAHKIMSFNPTTIEDYRKFILENIPGVRNVKISPADYLVNVEWGEKTRVKGFYRVVLELEPDLTTDKIERTIRRKRNGQYTDKYTNRADQEIAMKHYVKNQLLKHRNLCENFLDAEISTAIPVGLCLEVELDKEFGLCGIDKKKICQDIYDVVSEYVSPHIHHYTIPEMLNKGLSPEDIYKGVLPRLGFLDMNELAEYDKRDTLYIPDIISLILSIKGVKGVKHIHFNLPEAFEKDIVTGDSFVKLKDTELHHFSFSSEFFTGNGQNKSKRVYNEFRFCKDWFAFYASPEELDTSIGQRNYLKGFDVAIPQKESRHRNTERYHSFQNLLPQCYYMDQGSRKFLQKAKGNEEKLQLKAYLTFFDQILADYLAQLDSFRQYFSVTRTKVTDSMYMHHHLSEEEICGVSQVLENYKAGYAETNNEALEHQSRLLDHLMARFNDAFADYVALQYALSGGNPEDFSQKENNEDKKRYLKRYPEISGCRAQSLDVTERWELSGIEKRIFSRLGINDISGYHPLAIETYGRDNLFYDNRSGSFDKNFGLHIIEHSLLVPVNHNLTEACLLLGQDNDSETLMDDPYSFMITAVLPGWLDICQNLDFRKYVEGVIREEVPAHILTKICWIGPDKMKTLEEHFNEYLSVMKHDNHPKEDAEWCESQRKAITALIYDMNSLTNIYPMKWTQEPDSTKKVEQTHLDGDVVLDKNTIKSDVPWVGLIGKEKK